MTEKRSGSCLCGGVAYEIHGPAREIVACHCRQCRKTSGHHVAATRAEAGTWRITNDERLTWYQSSDEAERGFCNRCGGNVFWRRRGAERVSIMAGTLDDTSGLPFKRHIFVKDRANYFDPPQGDETFPESD